MNKNANQQQTIINARHKINKSWQEIEGTTRYRSASAKEVCDTITKMIEIELQDSIQLNLSVKSQVKPTSVQNRMLRCIVEKRQAQASHKKYGRTEGLTLIHISIAGISRCMEIIHKKRFAA